MLNAIKANKHKKRKWHQHSIKQIHTSISRREWRKQENSGRKQQYKQQRRTKTRKSVIGREDTRNCSNKDKGGERKKWFGTTFLS